MARFSEEAERRLDIAQENLSNAIYNFRRRHDVLNKSHLPLRKAYSNYLNNNQVRRVDGEYYDYYDVVGSQQCC